VVGCHKQFVVLRTIFAVMKVDCCHSECLWYC